MQISNRMNILEIISYYRSDPFTLINLYLPINSYRIASTKNQNFEEGENRAYTILVDHTFGPDMNLFGSDMILFGSSFKLQEPSVMLVSGLINFGVTNQVPQVSFKLAAGDLMLVSSYEFSDIIFCESLVILEAILDYGSQAFALYSPRTFLHSYLIACSSPHRTSKDGDILHSPEHFLLTLGDDFTSHGSMLKGRVYHFLGFSSHGLNSQEIFLFLQLISTTLHGSSFHRADVYIFDQLSPLFFFQSGRFHQTYSFILDS